MRWNSGCAIGRRCSAAVGLVVVIMIVGALYPSLKDTFGKLNVPQGVANLLGGADYSTLTGWLQSRDRRHLRPARVLCGRDHHSKCHHHRRRGRACA